MKFTTLATVTMLAASTSALRLEHQNRAMADAETEVKLQQLAKIGERMEAMEEEMEEIDWDLRSWFNNSVVHPVKQAVHNATGSHDLWNSIFHRGL